MIPITIEHLLMLLAIFSGLGACAGFWLGVHSEKRLWLRHLVPAPFPRFTDPAPLLDAPIGAAWPTTNDRITA